MTNTQKVSAFISGQYAIPEEILATASRLIMDSVGCALGALCTEPGRVVGRFARSQGTGSERVLGTGIPASPTVAAYSNGRLINIIDQDETYLVLGHHANAALGAALALASTCNLTGETLCRAFAIGYEIGARAGNFMGVQLKVDDAGKVAGWNFPGPILGAFAACASACVCLKLDAAEVENALGICAMYLPSNSGGIWEEGRKRSTLPTIKYEDCGLNTQVGVMAALMAKQGVTGTLGVFEKDISLAHVASAGSTPNYDAMVDGLGSDWRITRTSIKLWPSCRWFHYALTALDFAMRGHAIDPAAVDSVEIWSASSCCLNASPEIGEHIVMDASFSVPHSVAMMLMGVPAGPAWFDPAIALSEQADALRRKVKIQLHPALRDASAWGPYAKWGTKDAPLKVPSRAVIRCGEQTFEGDAEYAYGDCWSEAVTLSDARLQEKFITLAKTANPDSPQWEARMVKMADRLLHIGAEDSVASLLAELDAGLQD